MYRDLEGFTQGMIIALVLIIIIAIAINVLYLLTLQNCLKNISAENRKMPATNVWLLLIPVFSIVYQFIVVTKIADSLEDEFKKRNIPCDEPRPGYNVGLAYCICFCLGIVPVVGGLASIPGLVCWIVYWVKISNYSKQLGPLPDDSVLDSNI